jgi:hypothetical protein
MDNHPIPQDITGFQFKLIGKMTIRQFIYVAVGAVIAWVMFFILEPPSIIKWPVSLLSLGIGTAIAFVPIDGRPMDTMIKNFITALLAPTQFIYQKDLKEERPMNYSYSNSRPPIIIPQQEAPIAKYSSPPAPAAPTGPVIIEQTIQAPPPVVFPDEQKPQATIITDPIVQSPPVPIQAAVSPAPQSTQPIQVQPEPTQDQKDLESMLAESIRQKEALEKQILEMRAKHEASEKPKFTPVTAQPREVTQKVRKIPADMASSVGVPVAPEHPNLITGIIKDPRGNPVSNILVEIRDPEANPVRAFKTNALGKFASATPLSNGKYIIAFEDPGEKHKFDEIEIELTGNIVMPLEVISVDPREELRRELFN